MSVREPGSLSRANGAQLVVDYFLRGCRLIKKKTIRTIPFMNSARVQFTAVSTWKFSI